MFFKFCSLTCTSSSISELSSESPDLARDIKGRCESKVTEPDSDIYGQNAGFLRVDAKLLTARFKVH